MLYGKIMERSLFGTFPPSKQIGWSMADMEMRFAPQRAPNISITPQWCTWSGAGLEGYGVYTTKSSGITNPSKTHPADLWLKGSGQIPATSGGEHPSGIRIRELDMLGWVSGKRGSRVA